MGKFLDDIPLPVCRCKAENCKAVLCGILDKKNKKIDSQEFEKEEAKQEKFKNLKKILNKSKNSKKKSQGRDFLRLLSLKFSQKEAIVVEKIGDSRN